jgi:hypothetical protein
MGKVVKSIVLFEESGPENTSDVIDCVAACSEELGIKDVLVASTSGDTGLKWSEALKGKLWAVNLFVISWKVIEPEKRKKMEKDGAKVLDGVESPFGKLPEVANAYRAISQGFKVCVEDALIAVDKGLIEAGKDVISVGGTGSGSDTALVVKAANSADRIGKDFEKRLVVREILALPRNKKWWV